MHLDHEFLADRHAALGFGAPETYASSLVALAAPGPARIGARARPSPEAPSPAGSAGSPLFQRILMLVACPFRVERRPPAWWRWSLSILVLLLTPLAACLCLDLGAAGLPASALASADPDFPRGPVGDPIPEPSAAPPSSSSRCGSPNSSTSCSKSGATARPWPDHAWSANASALPPDRSHPRTRNLAPRPAQTRPRRTRPLRRWSAGSNRSP